MSQQLKSILIFTALVLIWGSAFILIKYSSIAFNSYQVASLRVLAATLAMAPFVVGKLDQVRASEWKYIAISGVVGSFVPAFLFAYAMQNGIDSSTAGVLSAVTPAFTLIIGLVAFQQRTTWLQVIGLALGFGGAIVLMLNKSGQGFEFNNFGWLILLATFCYALNLTLVKYKLVATDPILITSFSLLLTLPITLGFLFSSDFLGVLQTHDYGYQSLFFAILLGVSATGIALHLFNVLIKISNPVFASSVTYVIPLVAILWAIVDGEHVAWLTIVSAFVVIFSVYLIRKS